MLQTAPSKIVKRSTELVITVFVKTKELLKLFFFVMIWIFFFFTSFKMITTYFIIEMRRLIATASLQSHWKAKDLYTYN